MARSTWSPQPPVRHQLPSTLAQIRRRLPSPTGPHDCCSTACAALLAYRYRRVATLIDDGDAATDQRHLGQDVGAEHTVWVSPKARITSRVSWIWPGSSPMVGSSSSSTLGLTNQRLGQPDALPVALGQLEISRRNTASRRQAAITRSSSAAMPGGARPSPGPRSASRRPRPAYRTGAGARAGSRSGAPPEVSPSPCRIRPRSPARAGRGEAGDHPQRGGLAGAVEGRESRGSRPGRR